MAYCPPRLLDDIGDLFAEMRTWAGVIEKSPGVFYVRRQPFLHFHLVEGGRQLDLPRPVSTAWRQALLRELRMRYGEKQRRSPRPIQVDRPSLYDEGKC